MCGIAGIVYKSNNSHKDNEVRRMCDMIIHRGPDDAGYFYDDRVALGHRRLSIIDLTPKGHQPMAYKERYQIVFNGEIYNHVELREELTKSGYLFHSDTDTEVLLASYDKWKNDCLPRLNGMWSFIIYDQIDKIVFASRDRFGVKPFYYTVSDERIAFASEIKEFTVLPDFKAKGNLSKIYDFLLNDGIHDFDEQTLFANVFQLRGGFYLHYNLTNADMKIEQYYQLAPHYKHKRDNHVAAGNVKTFYNLFDDSIKLRLRSDVKVGSCLSGGLDSSSIVCMIHERLKESEDADKQEVVFASNHVGKYDESQYEQAVVKKTGVIEHTVEMKFEDMMSQLDNIVWHQDEPFGSQSIIAQWNVYQKAREKGLIVMLDGQGADEYLAGYNSFHRIYFRELLLKCKWLKLGRSIANYRKLYSNYYYSPFRDLLETSLSAIISRKYLNKIKIRLKGEDNSRFRYLKNADVNKLTYQKTRKESTSLIEESVQEMMTTSLPKLLHHQDRNAMAHSVEARAPFLDYRLVEFVLSLPSDMKVKEGVTKFVLREALSGIIPDVVKNRMDKLGFATPEDVWIRDNRQEYRDLLQSSCDILHKIVRKESILMSFDKELNSKGPIDSFFWCVIVTAAWVRRFDVTI